MRKFNELSWDGNLDTLGLYVDVKIMPDAFLFTTTQSTKDMEAKMSPKTVKRMKEEAAKKFREKNEPEWYVNWYIREILNLVDCEIDFVSDDVESDIFTSKDRTREERLRHKNAEKLRVQWSKTRCAVNKTKAAKKAKRELRRSR